MFFSESRFTVRYAETDQMGIVHHSNYPVWFEVGRTDFIKQMGMPYSKIEEEGIMLPLIALTCNYKGTARYEDEITVKTSIKDFSKTRIVFYYEVYKASESRPITTGTTEHAWTNSKLRPVNLKKTAPELFELISKAI
jgi:acyl-CoA thioester hydrolase